ncbi:MAG: porin family protein [Bdellovibrionaceae bacterium]|nr:porin family protein [Pseudobdellovibrionaceae bacterium]
MTKALMITLFSLVSVVSFAQAQEDYNIETIERNISRSHDEDSEQAQEEYSDAMNEAEHTQNSPQINIYNANSNANKQNQKGKLEAGAEAVSDAQAEAVNDNVSEAAADSYVNGEVGNEYISRSNDIRKARKNMEIGTEAKMVEKIEWSRIEDEKDRADRLFGNRLDKNYNDDYKKEEPKVIIVEKPAYVAPVQAEPAYVAPAKAAAVYDVKTEEKEVSNWWGEEAYIAPMVGTLNYSADNVSSGNAFGVALGSRFDSNVSIEGSFLYGEVQMEDYNVGFYNMPGLKDVTQYGFGGAVKYNFGMGRISPVVGALGSYTMRDYQETRYNGGGTAESTAFDAGLMVGLDVKIAKNFSIGAEYRLMKNISNDREEDTQQIQPQFFQQTVGKTMEPLEEVDQSMLLLNGKFSF